MQGQPNLIACRMRQENRLAFGLIPLLNLLEDQGVDLNQLLNELKIPEFGLVEPAFTISIQQESQALEAAIALVGEAGLGLKLASYTRLQHFSVFGLALSACATFSEILLLINDYPNLFWGNCDTDQTVSKGVMTTTFEASDETLGRVLVERDMACAARLLEEAFEEPIAFINVQFAYPEPENIGDYERVFGCPVEFSQPKNAMQLSVDYLDKQLPNADPLAKAFYEAQSASMSEALKQPFSYREVTRERLRRKTPIPSLEQVAESLNMTGRTLQRKLQEEDTRFSELLQNVRCERAQEYLMDNQRRIEAIADALGFMDAAAFSHAFKKWVGLSPRHWRESRSR